MWRNIVFFLLPVALSATQLCEGDECHTRHARIAAGDVTEANSRPFQVALYLRVGPTGDLGFCGGSLVHQEWVLTAAHCCFHDGQQVDDVQAIMGAHSLYDRYENGRRIVNVAEIVVHPDFDPATLNNDLALLRLANIIQLTETVNIVRLPYLNTVSYNFAGQGGTVSGWGIAANGVSFISPTLREKLMTVMTDPLCNTFYSNQLPPNYICAFNSGAGTCKGDNGGPLTISMRHSTADDEPETILVGVVSAVSTEGCNNDLPSVFTRTQRYLPWISEVTGIVLN